MRVLVTGGAGFLGSHLCDKLVARGDYVICLDNYFSGRQENIEHLIGKKNFEVIRHDVQNPILLEVDQIYHLACPASPVFYQYRPIETMKTSVLGTINMLDLALRNQATFLLASTSECYGDPLVHPQVEEYWGNVNSLGIRSCYDEGFFMIILFYFFLDFSSKFLRWKIGKRAAESITMDYQRIHGVQVRIARIFNSYGPRMYEDDGRVVSNFIVQALEGKNITIYGSGNQVLISYDPFSSSLYIYFFYFIIFSSKTRSFCYCTDTINGLFELMNHKHIGPINIGMPFESTIRELAEKVLELVSFISRNPPIAIRI